MENILLYALLAVWLYFMYRRGGCCGGHRQSEVKKKNCCDGKNH